MLIYCTYLGLAVHAQNVHGAYGDTRVQPGGHGESSRKHNVSERPEGNFFTFGTHVQQCRFSGQRSLLTVTPRTQTH